MPGKRMSLRPLPPRQQKALVALLHFTWFSSAPTTTALAEHLGWSCSSDVSRVLYDLERKGLLERSATGRSPRLTPEGLRAGLELTDDEGLELLAQGLGRHLAALRAELERRAALE